MITKMSVVYLITGWMSTGPSGLYNVQYLGVEVVVEVVPQQAVDQHRLTLKVVPTTKSRLFKGTASAKPS